MSLHLNFSLPKDLRIRKKSQYEDVFGKGKRLNTKHFTIVYLPNSLGYPRVGLVAGRKNLSGAVGRNRVKRVIREVFRLNKSLFDSMDVVLIAKEGSGELRYVEAKREIESVMGSNLL